MGSTPSKDTTSPAAANVVSTPPRKEPLTSAEKKTNPEGLKPCCACKETRKARDTCFFDTGDEAEIKCKYLIEAHLKCMRDLGFNV
ncbi:hypothetical protein H4219_006162 [Mycoemilia scoparia]|uniref:Cytochrome c oxidase copper chaperone n=1 Tax=Mycoemilia scoparia TaxID=417184 RepID=A0A9W7ZSQ4_9FUNG|nr:hypothetical protein H4219_006162 [Mycoemilia scoparia]